MTPTALSITTQLIETRDFMRKLKGDGYAKWVEPARDVLRDQAKKSGLPLAEVALAIAKRMSDAYVDPSIIFCALCEEAGA